MRFFISLLFLLVIAASPKRPTDGECRINRELVVVQCSFPDQKHMLSFPKLPLTDFRNRKVLVFDLDETMVQVQYLEPYKNPFNPFRKRSNVEPQFDHYVEVQVYENEEIKTKLLGISVRPGLYDLLDFLKQYYSLAMWTAGSSTYANTVLSFIDPTKKYFPDFVRFYGQDIRPNDPAQRLGKDLRIFGRDLKDVVMIDNRMRSFYYQLVKINSPPVAAPTLLYAASNGYLVQDFVYKRRFSDERSYLRENEKMKRFFYKIKEEDDVRKSLVQHHLDNSDLVWQQLRLETGESTDRDLYFPEKVIKNILAKLNK